MKKVKKAQSAKKAVKLTAEEIVPAKVLTGPLWGEKAPKPELKPGFVHATGELRLPIGYTRKEGKDMPQKVRNAEQIQFSKIGRKVKGHLRVKYRKLFENQDSINTNEARKTVGVYRTLAHEFYIEHTGQDIGMRRFEDKLRRKAFRKELESLGIDTSLLIN